MPGRLNGSRRRSSAPVGSTCALLPAPTRRKRHERTETERFRLFSYDELVARDKASLDIFWLRDESLEDTDNLPPPEVIAAEIVEDLEAALAQFDEIAVSLEQRTGPPPG